MTTGTPLPRRELREPAFRRYENAIAIACQGTVELNPVEFMDPSGLYKPLQAATFIQRMRDAMRGFKLYRYRTSLIPDGYDLTRIKFVELSNGNVLVQNTTQDYENKSKPPGRKMLDVDPNDPFNTSKWKAKKVRTGMQTYTREMHIKDTVTVEEVITAAMKTSFGDNSNPPRTLIRYDTVEEEQEILALADTFRTKGVNGDLVVQKDEFEEKAYLVF